MTLPTIKPAQSITLNVEALTPASFAPFGTVVASPLSPDLTSYPSTIPPPTYPSHQPSPVLANQATALKTSPISPLTNNYPHDHESNYRGHPGKGLVSIFSSFPRQNMYLSPCRSTSQPQLKLKLGILERHPYTTQTFCPFNYSDLSPPNATQHTRLNLSTSDKTYMLIIVAPTLRDLCSTPPNRPDLTNLRAFIAPLNAGSSRANVAVTYAPGTWHAPMIVLGQRRVDFLVSQFANGVADDDCQEVLIGSGPDQSVISEVERGQREKSGLGRPEVEIDVNFLVKGREGEVPDAGTTEGDKWTTDEAVSRTIQASRKAKL